MEGDKGKERRFIVGGREMDGQEACLERMDDDRRGAFTARLCCQTSSASVLKDRQDTSVMARIIGWRTVIVFGGDQFRQMERRRNRR